MSDQKAKWYRRLGPYIRPQWQALALVAALLAAGVGFEALKPWPMKVLVDYVLKEQPLPAGFAWMEQLPWAGSRAGLVAWTSVATVLLFVLAAGSIIVQRTVSAQATSRMTSKLAADVFDHAQRLSLQYHRRNQIGDLTRRTTHDCECVQTLVASVALPLITAVLSLVVMFSVMYRLDAELSLLSLVVAVPLTLLIKGFSRPLTNRTYAQYELEGELMAMAEQALTAVPVVQAFGREDYEDRRFRALSDRTVRAFLGATVSQLQFQISTSAVTALGTAAVIVVGGNHVLDGQITVGGLLVFLSYLASLYAPLETLTTVSTAFASAAAGARRVLSVVDEPIEVGDRSTSRPLQVRAAGHVVLENVTYGYIPEQPAVRDVSIDARPGETIALVGRTGAGKSTIAGLVARLADPWSGRVLLDGQDLRDIELRSLRQNIAHVLQDPYLLAGTIAENITYGRPEASFDEIVRAADAANASRFIDTLPEGYDTVIGERGVTLSGGERQRIAIARAILKDAPVLILDEPTAALDVQTEAQVVEALDRLAVGRTTFIIAHRLSTLASADRVIVIDAGHVAEEGSPDELARSGGIYAQMLALQQQTDVAPAPASEQPSANLAGAYPVSVPPTGQRRPLRVCLVSQEYPPETAHGGIASQAFIKATGLVRRGHEVTVLSATSGPRTDNVEHGVRVIRLPWSMVSNAGDTDVVQWLSRSTQVANELSQLHAQTPFDLVEFAEYGAEGYVHLLNRTEWDHLPTVIQLHGPLVMLANTIGWPALDSELYRTGTAMEATCVRLADLVYSSSDCSADWCAENYGVPRDAIPRLHMGVDTSEFHPWRAAKSSRSTIVFVGRISASKGVDVLVDASIDAARTVPDLRLRLIGRDADGLLPELQHRAVTAGYPDLIDPAGQLPHAELAAELASAHLFAAPSLFEGGPGLVYLEAMASGIPVIAGSGSGASEVVIPDENGLLVPPGDRPALAAALTELLCDDDRRVQLGRQARAWVVAGLDSELCIDRLEKLYVNVVETVR